MKEGDDSAPGGHFAVHDAATGKVLRQFVRQGPGNYAFVPVEHPFDVSARGSRLALRLFKPNLLDVDHLEVWDTASGQRLQSLGGDALGGSLCSPVWMYNSQALDAAGTRLAVRIERVESRRGDRRSGRSWVGRVGGRASLGPVDPNDSRILRGPDAQPRRPAAGAGRE